MDNSFSGKGKAWEWRHSIWILWTLPFPGFTSFISFLYIGKRTKTKKWIVFGLIYLAWILFLFLYLPLFPSYSFIGSLRNAFYTAGWVLWIWSIIHAFIVRKEYLVRLAYLSDHPEIREKARKKYYDNIVSNYKRHSCDNAKKINKSTGSSSVDATCADEHKSFFADEELTVCKTDINLCSFNELLSLPGITVPIAQKVIDRRSIEGDFYPVDEFLDFVMVKPHFAVKLKDMIAISTDRTDKQSLPPKRNMDF